MTLRHIRIFLQVYQSQSVTKAAEALHMTQPAVTRAVQALEGHYGVRLFERINHRLYPAESARRLYGQAVHLLDSFEHMERDLRNWDDSGVLRVGAGVTLGGSLLPGLVCRFREQRPRMQVRVTVANGSALRRMLLDNELDMALAEGETGEADLQSLPLGGTRFALIAPPGHPLLEKDTVTAAGVAAYPLLLREAGSAGRAFLDSAFAVRGITVRPLWESVSTRAIIEAAARGVGISLLPEPLVRDELAAGRLCTREVADMNLEREQRLVWHRDKYFSEAMREFRALCAETAGASFAAI